MIIYLIKILWFPPGSNLSGKTDITKLAAEEGDTTTQCEAAKVKKKDKDPEGERER